MGHHQVRSEEMIMRYGVFYMLYEREQSIASDSPVDMEPAQASREILAAMDGDGDYLGLIDRNGTVLQIMYDLDDDRFWAEIPLLEQQASHGCWLDYAACEALLMDLPETFTIQAFPDFVHTPWQNAQP